MATDQDGEARRPSVVACWPDQRHLVGLRWSLAFGLWGLGGRLPHLRAEAQADPLATVAGAAEMTGPVIVLCIWLVAPTPFDVVLTSMGLVEPPPCVMNEVAVVSYEHCMKLDKPAAIRRLNEQGLRVTAECRP